MQLQFQGLACDDESHTTVHHIVSGSALLATISQQSALIIAALQALKFPNAVVSAVVACKNGIKRTHIVDARIDGGLLLELYSRDGVGTMISTDFYEGIRGAQPSDLDNIMVGISHCRGIPGRSLRRDYLLVKSVQAMRTRLSCMSNAPKLWAV